MIHSVSEDKFNEIYALQYADIRNFCYYKLGNVADAEDVTQLVFMDFLRAGGRFEERDKYKGLLIKMATFKCWNHYNSNKKHQKDGPLDRVILAYSFDHKDEFQVEGKKLQRCLNRLPRQQRQAFLMRVLHELEYRIIAKVTNSRISTSQNRVETARKKLREYYETC